MSRCRTHTYEHVYFEIWDIGTVSTKIAHDRYADDNDDDGKSDAIQDVSWGSYQVRHIFHKSYQVDHHHQVHVKILIVIE